MVVEGCSVQTQTEKMLEWSNGRLDSPLPKVSFKIFEQGLGSPSVPGVAKTVCIQLLDCCKAGRRAIQSPSLAVDVRNCSCILALQFRSIRACRTFKTVFFLRCPKNVFTKAALKSYMAMFLLTVFTDGHGAPHCLQKACT